MKKLDDLEIIASVKRGNVTDFSLLMDRYGNKAYSMIMRMLKNSMDAEEVLQDSFVKAYQNLGSFKGDAKFSTWFYRIVYNTTISRLSVKKRKTEGAMLTLDEDIEIAAGGMDTENLRGEQAEMVEKLIELLPPNYAAVVNLFYLEDMSCEQIAGVMNTSVQNIKVLLHRSRSALKKLIKENDLEDELR
ncbi:MAG: DNA-directed RNA polymerase sigma-70 factor [Ignavibacteriaceae bacterium]|nr:MAG: DNA-directed RNA polymerase sigma-70 factor [Ignavibacteriaceae bacterium]